MKKTLFGFSAVALAAAAFVLPATGASVHDEPQPAPHVSTTIDNGGADSLVGQDLAFNFAKVEYTNLPHRD